MNQYSQDILQHFYPYNPSYSNTNIPAITTNFKISNLDISNNYVGIGTNSNITVNHLYPLSYFSNSINIGDLFELNLPLFTSGTINVDYKMFPNNGGMLIQFLKTTFLSFNYNVKCSFCMVGGGGGGGYKTDGNAGGGGGAGEIVTGSINIYIKNTPLEIVIGEGGSSHISGSETRIEYQPPDYFSTSITANGGGYGGYGKGNGGETFGSSSGGGGSYSEGEHYPGVFTPRTINSYDIFQSMLSYGNTGAIGNDNNDDKGGGGGGGGAGEAAEDLGNGTVGPGGDGKTITYGNTSFQLAGGGGGGGRENGEGGAGGSGGGGKGGGPTSTNGGNGYDGTSNTGGGGGGASNDGGIGGRGGSGTVIFYIQPEGVSI